MLPNVEEIATVVVCEDDDPTQGAVEAGPKPCKTAKGKGKKKG